jgi:hypothetical protein
LAKVSPNGRKIMMCFLVTNTLFTEQQVKEAEEFKKDSITLRPQSLKRGPTPSMVVDQTKANSKSKVKNTMDNIKEKSQLISNPTTSSRVRKTSTKKDEDYVSDTNNKKLNKTLKKDNKKKRTVLYQMIQIVKYNSG